MSNLTGINHVTFLTADMDRLAAFYEDMFQARRVLELPVPEHDGRHALIEIGDGAALHALELASNRAAAVSADVRAWSHRSLCAQRARR